MEKGSTHAKLDSKLSWLLFPFLLWFAYSCFYLTGKNYAQALSYFQHPFHLLMAMGFALLYWAHAYLQFKEILEDYLRNPLRRRMIIWTEIKLIVAFIITVVALVYIKIS